MKRLAREAQMRDLGLFMQNISGTNPPKLIYFHPFQCPVSVAEAKVNEHRIQEYSVFSLLILRLFNAGFRTEDQIASISGMSIESVHAFLEKEMFVFQHIDPDTGRLTEMGLKTLEENTPGTSSDEGSEPKSHVTYNTPRRLQIEAVTGTVIPSYLERGGRDTKPDEDEGYFILPRETVERDEELRREMNERLREYIDADYVDEGDIIENVTALNSVHLFYRWAYLAKFEGMRYSLIVMSGRRRVDNVNARSNIEGNYNKDVAVPLAISESDHAFLKSRGTQFTNILVRSDRFFEYLDEKIRGLELTMPTENDESAETPADSDTGIEEDDQ